MKNIFKNLTKKIVQCPNCGQKLRVPIKAKKTLRITCNSCKCAFDIRFQTPFQDLFTWYPGYSFWYNLKSFYLRFKILPLNIKFSLLTMIVLSTMIISAVVGTISSNVGGNNKVLKAPVHKESELPEGAVEV